MNIRHSAQIASWGLRIAVACAAAWAWSAFAAPSRQEYLDHWRSLTAPPGDPVRVFVNGNRIRFFFNTESNIVEYEGSWNHRRVPSDSYAVNSALLRWTATLPRQPDLRKSWREATVIAGSEWRRLSTNLVQELTPAEPGHGACYQAFLGDRVFFRTALGAVRSIPQGDVPEQIVIDHRYSVDETLDVLSVKVEEQLVRTHPGDNLFLIMAPDSGRFTQPLLLDRQQKQCIWLSPAALYDTTERGPGFAASLRGFAALIFESHGLALIKNPVSCAARLADLGVQSAVHLLQLPLPKPGVERAALSQTNGMDLQAWEKWLDTYTGTRREQGSIELLIDGDRFYSRLQHAIAGATNHISVNVFIFDRDDVAVSIADELKRRSTEVEVRVILDQLGSLGAGLAPPTTPMAEDFVMPTSIVDYLRSGSDVHVRPFLNPWLSTDHSKVYLVDGTQAWIGGMNLGREYRYEWHDLMIQLGGPVVGSLENEFARHWAHEGPLGDLSYAAALLSPGKAWPAGTNAGNWIPLRRLPSRTGWKPYSAAVHGAIEKARGYIYVENPYLFDKNVISELVLARRRGVDVRVVLPRVNDFKTGGRSNLVIANYLHEQGVRVYFYPGMTHVKALLADGWACVGSGNLTHLSLHLSQEENIATSDPAFAAELKKALFEQDFARSYELNQPISVDWVDTLADTVLESF
ncbi:MAG: phosphatidylserine/phosphatidylglycerophosphate/cardiolipin synthase family protein [Verrucomicrobiota bacterium]